MFESISNASDLLFFKHQENLKKNYPGINKEIFRQELQSYIGEVVSSNHLVNSIIQTKINTFEEIVLRGVPFQHILGMAHFYGREFICSEKVLIPRQETEVLVEEVVNTFKNLSSITALDLCAGSGCIGLTLACELGDNLSSITLTDVSPDALTVLEQNIDKLEYQYSKDLKIDVIHSDLFERVNGTYDLIVSNPPYIKKSSHQGMVHAQVLSFEPHIALFIEDGEYEVFFNKLFTGTRNALASQGMFIMEGHENEIHRLESKWNSLFKDDIVQVLNDLTGRPRFLKIIKDSKRG